MKKWYSVSLNVVGIINLFLAGLHISFWKIFDWNSSLASISDLNRNVLYTLNIIFIICIFGIVIITIYFKKELVSTSLGKFILVWFSVLDISRAVVEISIWNPPGIPIIILESIFGIIYILPILKKEWVLSGK